MQLTFLHGYPDYVGKRFIFAGYGTGPVSYLATGDPIVLPRYDNYIDTAFPALTLSGNYEVRFAPSTSGSRAIQSAFWFYSGKQGVVSVTQNVAGTGMTPGTYVANATGGGGAGAQIQVTVLTATTIGPVVLLSTGSGYTSGPTFAPATGGTPPTFNVVIAPGSGLVAAGLNLSAETVQFGGFGGVY
jgi:hypothetical protein